MSKELILLATLCDKDSREEVVRQVLSMPKDCFRSSKTQRIFSKFSNGEDVTSLPKEDLKLLHDTVESDEYKVFAGSPEMNQIELVEKVLKKYKDTKVLEFVDDFTQEYLDADHSTAESAMSRLNFRINSLPNTDRPITLEETHQQVLDNVDEIMAGNIVPVISSGYRQLDSALSGGFGSGDIISIVGKSGNGKTTFLQNLLLNIFQEQKDKKILYISTEMSNIQIHNKLGTMINGDEKIGNLVFKDYREPTSKTRDVLVAMSSYMENYHLHFKWCNDVKDLARHLYREEYDIVVLDHLHDLKGIDGKEGNSIVAEAMGVFKEWVLGGPDRTSFVLCQPRKGGVGEDPTEAILNMDDIRGGQPIQSNSSIIMSICANHETNNSVVYFLKDRHTGSLKAVPLKFDRISQRFRE